MEAFHVNWKGSGDAQYPPRLLLALLIYSYATGRSSSRAIEAATYSDVIVRYVCANTHPDHDTICAFRTRNRDAFKAAFVQVLEYGHALKLTAVGVVSVDGTKIAANASKHAAVSYQRAGEMIEQLEMEVEQLVHAGLGPAAGLDGICQCERPAPGAHDFQQFKQPQAAGMSQGVP